MYVAAEKEVRGCCGEDLHCEIITSQVDVGDQMGYTTYGVRLTNNQGKVLCEFGDISTDEEFVRGFIRLCEENAVSELHFADVLEDYLP